MRAENPRSPRTRGMDAVDVVISVEDADQELAVREVEDMVARLRAELGRWVFTQGDGSWSEAISERLGGRSVAVVELGTAGQVTAMLGDAEFLTFAELIRDGHDVSRAATDLGHYAERVRDVGHADIGLAVMARETKGDTHVRVAISTSDETYEEKRVAFLGGNEGRRRAALSACSAFWAWLGERPA